MSKIEKRKINKENLKTIGKKLGLIALALSPIYLYFIISYSVFLNDPIEKKPWVSWYDDPYQRVYISWETEDATKGTVYYGTNKESLTLSVAESAAVKIHHVNLTSLTSDTKYYYEVKIDGQLFGNGEFKTAPSTFEPFTWVMISDTQQNLGQGHHYRVARVLDTKDYAFIANVGDLVEEGEDIRYYNNFFTVASTYLDTIPIVPVIGNHDDHSPSLFQDYYINRVNESQELFYYSFNWSSVHFQICHFPRGRLSEMTEAQMAWIEQDLANAQSMPFRVVMFHCPIIGSSFFGRNEALIANVQPLLLQYNVTAVIHGHEHHFERGHIGNMMFMILGGGGGALDVGLRPQPETEVLTACPCYTEVHASASSLTFRTLTLEGEIIDCYTISV